MNTLQRGFWAGIMATGPINAPVSKLYHFLPSILRSRHDPQTIGSQMTNFFRFNPFMARGFQPDNPITSQLGYSIACGIIYAVTQGALKGPSLVKGGFFGLGIWAASRYGWLPALQSSRPAIQKSSRIPPKLLDFASHLLWGISLGVAEEKLRLLEPRPQTETLH